MKKFILSSMALEDLHEVWAHIALDNLDAADRVVNEMEQARERLAEFPHLGHRRADVNDPRYRFWSVYSYLIIYAPATTPLEIVRIVSGYRDIKRMIGS